MRRRADGDEVASVLTHLRRRGSAWGSDLGHGWPNGIGATSGDSGRRGRTTLLHRRGRAKPRKAEQRGT